MSSKLAWTDLEILSSLGGGHAGEVFLARLVRPYRGLGQGSFLAVKCYRPWVLAEPGQHERIMRELLVGKRLNTSHVVKPLCIVTTPEGAPALVMPHLKGRTLDAIITESMNNHLPLHPDRAFSILQGLAHGLAALHSADAIHRDLKPSNIMVSEDGHPTILDLGVVSSRQFAEQSTTLHFLGTIRYAAPEYLFGDKCTRQADVYSLGAIAYELFSGWQFFGGHRHWAQLVAARRGRSGMADHELERSHLWRITESSTIGHAEAARYLVRRMLVEDPQSRITSSQIQSLLSRGFWLSPFYIDSEKEIHFDEPRAVPEDPWIATGGAIAALDFSDQPLSNLQEQLAPPLTPSELRELHEFMMKEFYWEDRNRLINVAVDDNILATLRARGVVKMEPTRGMGAAYVPYIRSSLLLLYRYGYLQQKGPSS